MSLEPGHRQNNSSSPLSSGRASPAPRRRNDDGDIARKDPKYKRYAANIEKALVLFEAHALQEWADYISFLGRLLKALQSYPTFPQIPQRVLVSKRLAQCLNSRLPSGVHQKTIEVYSYIFSLIGRDGLANDLAIWTPGLMPVLSYASITVKPHYLSLLETFYLPLGKRLRPALKSLILALLPGIDEEGGEYFDETFNLLEGVRAAIDDDAYFWQCFLLATITSHSRRQGALAFLTRKLPKMNTEEARNSPLVTPEPGLLVRCFSAGLHDDNLLVQRGFLDLLVQNLPLSSPILQKLVTPIDLELLITSAAGVVLRRDMSLNRRLWVWLLGPEFQDQSTSPNHVSGTEYFSKYGLQGMIDGLRQIIDSNRAEPAERARPPRICLSLMDRFEIGGLVVPYLFVPVIRSIKNYQQTAASKEQYQEVVKSGAMFFDGVESHLIWSVIHQTISSALNSKSEGTEDAIEMLELVSFILKTFNVREEEMVVIHAPLVVLALLVMLRDVGKTGNSALSARGFALTEELLELIPQRAFHATKDGDDTSVVEDETILPAINKFYSRQTTKSDLAIPFSANFIGGLLLREVSDVVREAIASRQKDNGGIGFRLLVHIMKKVPKVDSWGHGRLAKAILEATSKEDIPFTNLQGSAHTVSALCWRGYLSKDETDNLVFPIAQRIWYFLSPETPRYHVEAVRALWTIQDVLKDRRIEAAISSFVSCNEITGIYEVRLAESGRKFSVLWTHSIANSNYQLILTRPLFLFLDSLVQEGTELHVFARGWLQNLQATSKLLYIFVQKLLGFKFLRDPGARDANGNPVRRPRFQLEDDLDVCSYYLQTLSNVLRYLTDSAMASLAKDKIITIDEDAGRILKERGFDEEATIQDVLVSVLIWAIDGEGDASQSYSVSKLYRTALSVLHQILLSLYSDPLANLQLENILTARLISLLNSSDTYIQVSFLDVLYAALKLSMLRSGSPLNNLRRMSIEAATPGPKSSRLSLSIGDSGEKAIPPQPTPPTQLVRCLIGGFSSPSSRPVLDSWVNFLAECLPLLSEVIYQILIPLVECMVEQIRRNFESLKVLYSENDGDTNKINSSENCLVSLLNGLEQLLATAHDKLMIEEVKNPNPKSPHEAGAAGFFGTMVSGVFSTENPQSKNAAANNRLTVLLCFQDTVRICYSIWSWGDQSSGATVGPASQGSFAYTSMKLRSRSRRILEHMFAAETLECLETLIQLWVNLGRTDPTRTGSIFKLINVLDGSRPKFTIPAIFNAIYSRTTPSTLENSPVRKSTLTAEISDLDVVVFLVEYALSLEDDAMDEIWVDCMTFLKDVLGNPFPYRGGLPSLVQFIAVLGEKVDNTNFGEQKKMRKDLGDLFLRLLTAAFTVRPINTTTIIDATTIPSSPSAPLPTPSDPIAAAKSAEITTILVPVVPNLRKILIDPDRVLAACTTISTSIIGPLFRSKSFPGNISPYCLDLLYQLTRIQGTQKAWKKDLSDAFNDPKFFQFPVSLVKRNWLPLLRQWLLGDGRDRLIDLLAKITPPTTAGVLFGTVGASSARAEADRKTQLNLRRIACLIFAADTDNFVPNLKEIEDTLVELLNATSITSPSSATRGDVYLVLRALILRMSPVHLNPFWPMINTELQSAIASLLPEETSSAGSNGAGATTGSTSVGVSTATGSGNSILLGGAGNTLLEQGGEWGLLQACKLLDTLLIIRPDEWQLGEWLFITDSGEAVFRPPNWVPTALTDVVASYIPPTGALALTDGLEVPTGGSVGGISRRRPWFSHGVVRQAERAALAATAGNGGGDGTGTPSAPSGGGAGSGQIMQTVLRPFFRNLSLYAYESTYSMGVPDVAACEEMLLADVFGEVGAGGS